MLPLLPGFVFGLLPPGNTLLGLGKPKAITNKEESTESQNKFVSVLQWLGSIVHMHLQALLVKRDS